MSIYRLRQKFRKSVPIIMWILIAAFVITVPLYVVGPGMPGGCEYRKDLVAKINGYKIGRTAFLRAYDNYTRQMNMIGMMYGGGGEVTTPRVYKYKYDTLEEMIEAILKQKAIKHQHIKASRKEIKAEFEKIIDDEIKSAKQQYKTDKEWKKFLKDQKLTEAKLRERIKEAIIAKNPQYWDALKQKVKLDKLEKFIKSQVTEKDLRKDYEEVYTNHILIKITKNQKEEQAKQKAEQIYNQLKAGADFAKLAAKYSEDELTKNKGGDLGFVSKYNYKLPQQAAEAAFKLRKNEISQPIKTYQGYHIIKAGERKLNLPKDFVKNKSKLLKELRERKWREYPEELKKQAKIEIYDHELRAYKALKDNKLDEAIKELKLALEEFPGEAHLYYYLGQIYEQQEKPDEAVKVYQKALEETDSAYIRLALGQIYQKKKKIKQAIEEYKLASEMAYDDPSIHYQLQSIYQKLGKEKEAAAEKKWLDDYNKDLQEMYRPRMGG